MAGEEAAAAAASGVRVGYAGRPGLVGLLSRNFFLTLVTIGIYRFWAVTRLRRYLWSNIHVAGDALEYTGTGRELFLGFLIALAVLAPLSIAYVISDRLALGSPALAASLQGFYFLALFVFLQVALFRSRRYRLSRTAWRGIYAGQTGSIWHYLGLYLGYGLLTVVTLGIALPWAQVALERYKLNHTWFGDRVLSIDAAGRDLLWRWLVAMALIWIPVLLAVLPNLNALLHPTFIEVPPLNPRLPPTRHLDLPHPGAFAFFAIGVVGGGLALVWYRIEAFRYLASRVTLGEMRLGSAARGSMAVGQVLLFGLGLAGVMVGIALIFVIVGMVALPILQTMVVDKPLTQQNGVVLVFAVMAPIYILMLFVFYLISYCWLWIPIIRHLASTLEIHNFAVAETIAQSTRPRQKLGIADSFELGAF